MKEWLVSIYIEVNQKYLIHLYLEEICHHSLAPVVADWMILVGDLYEKWKYVMYGCVWVIFYWLGAMGGPMAPPGAPYPKIWTKIFTFLFICILTVVLVFVNFRCDFWLSRGKLLFWLLYTKLWPSIVKFCT